MSQERKNEPEISGYISTLLRKHFGKGPTSVYVVINPPYIAIQLKNFMSPLENSLVRHGEEKRVLETRVLLMRELKPQILQDLGKITGMTFTELYADWNLPEKSGLFIVTSEETLSPPSMDWPVDVSKEAFQQKIETVNEAAAKSSGGTESIWLNKRILLVKRSRILLGIEKALIAEGYSHVLKSTKRTLERELLKKADFEEILQREILDIFLDWNFKEDKGYIIFVLKPV